MKSLCLQGYPLFLLLPCLSACLLQGLLPSSFCAVNAGVLGAPWQVLSLLQLSPGSLMLSQHTLSSGLNLIPAALFRALQPEPLPLGTAASWVFTILRIILSKRSILYHHLLLPAQPPFLLN